METRNIFNSAENTRKIRGSSGKDIKMHYQKMVISVAKYLKTKMFKFI